MKNKVFKYGLTEIQRSNIVEIILERMCNESD